jgi:hypothetical protein
VFRRSLLALLTALLPLLCAPASLSAEPLVRVRAESRIELGVAHQEVGMLISGALRDELGRPLSARLLALEAFADGRAGEPWRTQVSTDEAGRFFLELGDADHDYRLLATFSGDATHRGVRVERRVERARADVRLELRLPSGNILDLDAEELAIEALAESDAGGEGIAMRLSDETGRILTSGVTDDEGRLSLRIPSDRFAMPGPGLLRLESARDGRRAEAQTEARVVRRRAVYVELVPLRASFEAGGSLRIRGSVRTRVAPRAGVPLGLYASDRHLETVISKEDGTFQAELWIDAAPGPLEIRARAEADATGAYPAAEKRLQLRIEPARPIPVTWLAATALATASLLWLATRARGLKLLRDRDPDEGPAPLRSSVRPARAQGRRDRLRVNGRALDARNDAPLPAASVSIVHEDPSGRCTLRADEHGRFGSPVLPAGRARVLVEAEGYISTQTDIELPHRGEWTSFVVRLESLRDRALSPFRRLAMHALPSSRAWGIWTNREAREWLSQRTPAQRDQLTELTQEVERACYARETPSESAVAEIERVAHSIEAELPGPASSPSSAETRSVR